MQLSLDSPETPPGCLSVGELLNRVKEQHESKFARMHVEGEISNFTEARSGHCYFTLKDQDSQLQCVMWRSRVRRVRFEPEDGMFVRVRGSVTIYPARGQLQMQVSSMRLAGEGALQQAFEALKKKLEGEGLFDESIKKQLPSFPEVIGVITSGDGAALHDILSTLQRRFPAVKVQLCSVPVQGDGAAPAIVQAIECFHESKDVPQPDLLIVGRGGGSLEDLWAFNEEAVARAIHAATIPVISAVGHETDFSIADFVADVRAATPTMAAELAVPDGDKLAEAILEMVRLSRENLLRYIDHNRRTVTSLLKSRALHAPVEQLRRSQLKLDELIRRLDSGVRHAIRQRRHSLARLRDTLDGLHPEKPLDRGYALIQQEGRGIIKRGAALEIDESISIQFSDTRRSAIITDAVDDHSST